MAKLAKVRTAQRIFGRRAWLLGQEAGEGFPLLRGMVDLAKDKAEGAMDARRHLDRLGLKFFAGGLIGANSHPWLIRVFGDTEWDFGRHAEALRCLPGARPEKTYIGDAQQRGTLVPLSLLDEPQVA